jgi:transposase
MGRPSKYPAEFRQEAVRLALVSDASPAAVARRLGINGTTLRNWVADHLAEEARGSDPLAIAVSEREELRQLRKEVDELRTEREILGKAAANFAQETIRSAASGSSTSSTRLRRQAALWSPSSLAFRVLRRGDPAAVGASDPRPGADRGDPRGPRALTPHLRRPENPRRASPPRATLLPNAGGSADAFVWAGGRARAVDGGGAELTSRRRRIASIVTSRPLSTHAGWRVVGEPGNGDLVPPDDPDPP